MQRMKNPIFLSAFLFLAFCLLMPNGKVKAAVLPDLSAEGSICVTMRESKEDPPVPGGTMTIYHVAEAVEENSRMSYVYTKEFEDCGIVLGDLSEASLAEKLRTYVNEAKKTGITKKIGTDGTVTFEKLSAGLYLLVQEKAAEGYYAVSPFVATVPVQRGGGWVYDVDATPKMELYRPEATPPAKKPPSTSTGTKLPQTGQLNWPIPVLTIAGLLVFVVGWRIVFKKRKKS